LFWGLVECGVWMGGVGGFVLGWLFVKVGCSTFNCGWVNVSGLMVRMVGSKSSFLIRVGGFSLVEIFRSISTGG